MRRLLAILVLWFLCSGFGPGWQKPPLGAQLNRSHPLAQGLVGAWLFNEGSGSVVNDFSRRNNLTERAAGKGPLWVNGDAVFVKTELMGLNCTDVKLPTLSVNPYMFVISFRLNSVGVVHTILSFRGTAEYNPQIYVNAANKIALYAGAGAKIISNLTVSIGISYTIILIRSSISNLSLWIDGVLDKVSTDSSGYPAFAAIRVGHSTAAAEYMNGSIKFIYYYDRPNYAWLDGGYAPYAMFQRPILSRPWLNIGSGGAPPAAAPTPRKGQAIIIGKAGRNDIIAWVKEGE